MIPTNTDNRFAAALPVPFPNRLNQGKSGSAALMAGSVWMAQNAVPPATNRLANRMSIFRMPPTPALFMPPKNT